MGRVDRYSSHVEPFLEDVGRWKAQGLTEKQIAENLGISESVLQKYKTAHPELKYILLFGNKKVSKQLYNTILEQANGYYKKENKTRRDKNGEIIYMDEIEKYFPPDYRFILLWLINNDPNFKMLSQEQRDYKDRELAIKEKKNEADNW